MSTTNTLRGLATNCFYAPDLAAARKWYAELLGTDAYYAFPNTENPAYIEFRIGDYEHELGFIDKKYAPPQGVIPGGSISYWHVDNIEDMFKKLLDMGAKEYQPITQYGDAGFVTASVVDPFGNVLGVMYNPHYLDILNSGKIMITNE